MKYRAVFLDRDGTLVYPRHYPSRPEELLLYDGIGPELCKLQQAGFRLVVITNQAGIARGYFTEAGLQRMHEHLTRELARWDVQLDGIYYCPHHPAGVVPGLAIHCKCRKPQPGMLLKAAADLDLDLQRSWFVGDILDDIEAGNRAGCRGILVDLGTEKIPQEQIRCPSFVARNTCHALRIIGAAEHIGLETDLNYCPPTWQDYLGGVLLDQPCNDAITSTFGQQGCKELPLVQPCNDAIASTFGQQGCKELPVVGPYPRITTGGMNGHSS